MGEVQIRAATADDLPAINDIYNHYVRFSTCTYQVEPETTEDRRAWFAEHGPNHPVIVAERAGEILGWGALSQFKSRTGYDRTVEDSVYVRDDMLRKGIGAALLEDLLAKARAVPYHAVVAIISADQTPSMVLHEKFGFKLVGQLPEVGRKFGLWLDVAYMEIVLQPKELLT